MGSGSSFDKYRVGVRPATVDAPPAATQQVPAPTAPAVEELKGKTFHYVIDSLLHHLWRI